MKYLISGSSGLVGQALKKHLIAAGNTVYTLVRKKNSLSNSEIFWDPERLKLDPSCLSGFDCIINLSGENIADGYWTKQKKIRIFNSRINTTKLLAQTIALVENPPKVFLNASAIGIYEGSDNGDVLNEDSPHGSSFLSQICKFWEDETTPINELGIRTACLRFGIILSKDGGALSKMLIPFKFGLGGNLASGNQMMSWISLSDVINAIYFIATNNKISGPINLTAPAPISNKDLTSTLSKTLNRPAFFHLPKFLLRLIFGEMADELFLKSLAVSPQKLIHYGFDFEDKDLAKFLTKELT